MARFNKKAIAPLVGVFAAGLCNGAFASGFQLQEQNAANMGLAYAGTGTMARDASHGYYNAASLTHIKNRNFALSIDGLITSSDLTASAAAHSAGGAIGGGTDDPGGGAVIPTFHYAARLNDAWVLGLNLNVPFGLKTEYDVAGIARYSATRSEIQTFDFGPSLATHLTERLSVGFGPDIVYAQARLNQRVGIGSVATDGFSKSTADDVGYGFHLGFLWEASDATRMSFAYRSEVSLTATGDNYAKAIGTGVISKKSVRASLSLPESATISFQHMFNEHWTLMSDLQWTAWSRFRTLTLKFGDGSTATVNENWHDTYRFALGLQYNLNSMWQLNFGAAFDETAVRDSFMTARLPENDRYWATFGVTRKVNDNMRVDFAYGHIFLDDRDLNEGAPTTSPTPSAQSLVGTYESSVNLFGVQFTWDFD